MVMTTVTSYHGKTAAFHQSQVDTLYDQGFRIISLSVFGSEDHRRYAAAWAKKSGPTQFTFYGRTATEYQDLYNTWTKQGYRPTILTATGYSPASFAGVFEEDSTPQLPSNLVKHNIRRSEFFDRNQWAH